MSFDFLKSQMATLYSSPTALTLSTYFRFGVNYSLIFGLLLIFNVLILANAYNKNLSLFAANFSACPASYAIFFSLSTSSFLSSSSLVLDVYK